MDPLEIPLFELSFWVQLSGLPNGFMTESVGKQLGDFFGSFLSYDPNNNSSIWRECMRIRIKIDVRKPLKRKKKICRKNGAECIVLCKYERLGDFCFICGLVTHTERFCSKRSSLGQAELVREWGDWLRAPSRRLAGQEMSKWLRDEGDVDWGVKHGTDNFPRDSRDMISKNKELTGAFNSEGRIRPISKAIVMGSNSQVDKSNMLAANYKLKSGDGPTEEELTGLVMDERKRRRGLETNELMEVEGGSGLSSTDSALSRSDCAVSSPEILATLAMQASQSK